MVYRSTQPGDQLAQWLYRLVDILRRQGGSTWQSLVRTVSGKTAVIELDGIQLHLQAEGEEQLKVGIQSLPERQSVNFCSDAETLRDIIAGSTTLDAAVMNGKVYVRASLPDLLGINQVVMGILADSAINLQLQRLWAEFDQIWSHPASRSLCRSLNQQKANRDYLINQIPRDVLNITMD